LAWQRLEPVAQDQLASTVAGWQASSSWFPLRTRFNTAPIFARWGGACKSFGSKTDDSAESNAQVAQRIEKATQNAAQQIAATGGTDSQETKEARENRAQGASEQHAANTCHSVPKGTKYPLGESNSWVVSRGKREVQDSGSAESAADCTFNPPLDPQLQLLIERWPTLSKAVQQ
jgi:hypothetical protein